MELGGNAGVRSIPSMSDKDGNGGNEYADGLLERILDRNNMNMAYKRVKGNKGSHGVDGMTVDELLQYLRQNGGQIRESIRNGEYRPNPVRRVEIPKPDGGKRLLGIPTVLDRSTGITSHRAHQTPIQARAHELWDCHGGHTVTLYCLDSGHPRTVKMLCSSRVCATCRRRRQEMLFARWLPRMRQLKPSRLVLVTLTRKIMPGVDIGKKIKETRAAFGKLVRHKDFASCFQGGLYAVEAKLTTAGHWNVHIHALIELTDGARRRSWSGKSASHERCDVISSAGQKITVQSLSASWKKLTGDSYIVDIAPVATVGGATETFRYITKYLSKPPQGLCPDKTPAQVLAYQAATSGLRLVQGFGSWHDTNTNFRFVVVDEPRPKNRRVVCPHCGCEAWISEYELRRNPAQYRWTQAMYSPMTWDG